MGMQGEGRKEGGQVKAEGIAGRRRRRWANRLEFPRRHTQVRGRPLHCASPNASPALLLTLELLSNVVRGELNTCSKRHVGPDLGPDNLDLMTTLWGCS